MCVCQFFATLFTACLLSGIVCIKFISAYNAFSDSVVCFFSFFALPLGFLYLLLPCPSSLFSLLLSANSGLLHLGLLLLFKFLKVGHMRFLGTISADNVVFVFLLGRLL